MKRIITAISFVFMPCNIFSQSTGTITDTVEISTDVPVYEYVPKVIIEGKWGTGPGEFGYDGFYIESGYEGASIDEIFVPKSASFGPDDLIYPRSLAIDSKGNIYILDIANNRIQKFNSNGKYLKELKIDSWRGYKLRGEGLEGYTYEIQGINIVIDSKDNLYYYLKRSKDGKETGEALLRQGYEGQVWHFKNDKLVRKTPQIQEKPIIKKANNKVVKTEEKEIDADFKQIGKNSFTVSSQKENKNLKFKLEDDEELYGHRKVVYNRQDKNWRIRIKSKNKVWDSIYDSSGNLLKKVEAHSLSEFMDNKGNHYFIELGKSGLIIKKDELLRR